MTNPIKYFKVVVSSLMALLIIDLTVGFFVGHKYTNQSSKLKNYFNYGVSTAGKLKAIVGESNADAGAIALVGWHVNLPEAVNSLKKSCSTRISIYGMSFSNRIGVAAKKIDPCLSIRLIDGPGAPLSHSFYMYSKFKDEDDSQVIVVGVLASALPKINTVAHFNSAFEAPGAHVYPFYSVRQGELIEAPVPVTELNGFRELLNANDNSLIGYMQQYDRYYNPLVFGYEWADKSMIVRMLRRAYGQYYKRKVIGQYYKEETGFTNLNGMLDTSKAIFLRLNTILKNSNQKLIVLLINDQGYADSLDIVFSEFLVKNDISYISTKDVIDSRDNTSFLPDGHFRGDLDIKMAHKLIEALSEKVNIVSDRAD